MIQYKSIENRTVTVKVGYYGEEGTFNVSVVTTTLDRLTTFLQGLGSRFVWARKVA